MLLRKDVEEFCEGVGEVPEKATALINGIKTSSLKTCRLSKHMGCIQGCVYFKTSLQHHRRRLSTTTEVGKADRTLQQGVGNTLLWSRTKDLAHQYTQVQRDVFTLEDTLLGYLADDLTWCGEFETSGEALGPVELPRDV
ncbi:hypothetical protein P7K49_006154 [Saguinus oedipus]|uniref:ADP-ribosyl cyclase/cyclic ADP-ribose hydrolase 1 n=1 Tax=Saguinus oedipus TaxID=9490 RepID=A0ABQ9W1L4_SAGOE|nr:hypothetical protein P7K49_006154 [Saguinus oedipus]